MIRRGHRIKNGLEDDFCENFVKFSNIKRTKHLGEDQINENEM